MNAVLRSNPDYFVNIRRKIVWFVNQYEDELCSTVFDPPSELSDRLQNIWEGLLKLADFVDGGSGDELSSRMSLLANPSCIISWYVVSLKNSSTTSMPESIFGCWRGGISFKIGRAHV